MADQDDVRHVARSLPEVTEAEDRFAFSVPNRGKQNAFVWVWMERVHPKKARVPNAEVIAVRVADRAEKEALLASDGDVYFTEPHYNGFPAVLVRLASIAEDELTELITDAWRCRAPKELVATFDDARNPGGLEA